MLIKVCLVLLLLCTTLLNIQAQSKPITLTGPTPAPSPPAHFELDQSCPQIKDIYAKLVFTGSGMNTMVKLTAEADLKGSNPSYIWRVPDGEIVSGQYTKEIEVLTDVKSKFESFVVELKLGHIDKNCSVEFSKRINPYRKTEPDFYGTYRPTYKRATNQSMQGILAGLVKSKK